MMDPPYYTKNDNCERSQIVRDCKNCKDTSFEMLQDGELTDKCCRCGKKY